MSTNTLKDISLIALIMFSFGGVVILLPRLFAILSLFHFLHIW